MGPSGQDTRAAARGRRVVRQAARETAIHDPIIIHAAHEVLPPLCLHEVVKLFGRGLPVPLTGFADHAFKIVRGFTRQLTFALVGLQLCLALPELFLVGRKSQP